MKGIRIFTWASAFGVAAPGAWTLQPNALLAMGSAWRAVCPHLLQGRVPRQRHCSPPLLRLPVLRTWAQPPAKLHTGFWKGSATTGPGS